MNKRKGIFLLFLFTLITGTSLAFGQTEINIYYTASLNGNLVGCVCKEAPKAGLAPSAAYMRDINHENSIIVDLGDFSDARPDKLLSDSIIDVYKDLEYLLAAPGDQEMVSGIEYFRSVEKRIKFLCNNLKIDGKSLSPEPLIIEKLGLKIGIASVIEPSVFFFYPEDVKSRLEIEVPVKAADEMLKELERLDADFKLLLFHGHIEGAGDIFSSRPGWDAVLAAHDQILHESIEGKRAIASPGEEGNRVGRLSLSFSNKKLDSIENSFRYFKYHVDPEDPEVLQAFEEYKRVLIGNLKSGKK